MSFPPAHPSMANASFMTHPLVAVAFSLLATGALAGIVWIVRNLSKMMAILVGADGTNGLRGEVRKVSSDLADLRNARHQHGDALHAVQGEMALLKMQINTLDRATHDNMARVSRDVERLREDLGS